jgi:hypothetical protein
LRVHRDAVVEFPEHPLRAGREHRPAPRCAARGGANLKPVMSWHDPAVRQQLKLLAETDKTEPS